MRTALTVAGSDSGGGAGIQADLKSFAAVGVHGTSVITCVTSQNTRAVTSIFPLPPAEIRAQLRAILDDFDVRAAKTGMLYSAEIVRAVAEELRPTDFPLVVDPVMVATVGARLERDDFRDALVEQLLDRATLVTPNRLEAERLAGFEVRSLEDMERAARAIREQGASAVLVKGGHVAGTLVDVYDDGRAVHRFRGYRFHKELHGAGCTLAASIAGYLAQGRSLREAVEEARRRVAAGFGSSYRAGHGVEIINSHYRPDPYSIASDAAAAARKLPRILRFPRYAWTVAFSLPFPRTSEDVFSIRADGSGGFGGSGEAVRGVLVAANVNPHLRCAIALKRGTKDARRLEGSGLVVAAVGRFTESGIERAFVGKGVIPDVVAGGGGRGRGAITLVLGRNPEDAVKKLRRLFGRAS